MLENKLISGIENNRDEAFKLNEYLFNNPEVSGHEYNSSRKILEVLKSYGINADLNYYDIETAFFGRVIEKPNSGINIAILVEYDALPELGHACGHSASAAISILSAIVLKENEVLLLFYLQT